MLSATIAEHTTCLGEVSASRETTIEFPRGLLGFEGYRKYALIAESGQEPFVHLRSLDEPSLEFILVNPRLFFPHYKVEVDRREIAELDAPDISRLTTWAIVTVPEDWSEMSANLQGPLLINPQNGLGKQVVLVHGPYTTRHYLLEGLDKCASRAKRVQEAAAV